MFLTQNTHAHPKGLKEALGDAGYVYYYDGGDDGIIDTCKFPNPSNYTVKYVQLHQLYLNKPVFQKRLASTESWQAKGKNIIIGNFLALLSREELAYIKI